MMNSEFSTQNFYSIPQRYSGASNQDLQLNLRWWGNDAVELTLMNQLYSAQRLNRIKSVAIVLMVYGVFIGFTLLADNSISPQMRAITNVYIFHTIFLLWLLYSVKALFGLIKSEKILFCLDFALQLQTEGFMSRSINNMFISALDIQDIVLNEVIEDMDVHYVLILRTKGNLFQKQPIIPIFNILRPSIDCLEVVYKNLNKLLKNAESC